MINYNNMNNTNLIISIITGILTILGTVVIVCIGWGKMKQFMEDLEKSLCEFKKDIKDELRIIREDLRSHDKDIAFLKGRKYIMLYVGALYLRDFYIDEKFDKK